MLSTYAVVEIAAGIIAVATVAGVGAIERFVCSSSLVHSAIQHLPASCCPPMRCLQSAAHSVRPPMDFEQLDRERRTPTVEIDSVRRVAH